MGRLFGIDDKRIDMDAFYEELSERTGHPKEVVKEVIHKLFERIKYYMNLPLFPYINIKNVFSFLFNYKRIEKELNFTKLNYKHNKVGKAYLDHVVSTYEEAIKYAKKRYQKKSKCQKKEILCMRQAPVKSGLS